MRCWSSSGRARAWLEITARRWRLISPGARRLKLSGAYAESLRPCDERVRLLLPRLCRLSGLFKSRGSFIKTLSEPKEFKNHNEGKGGVIKAAGFEKQRAVGHECDLFPVVALPAWGVIRGFELPFTPTESDAIQKKP